LIEHADIDIVKFLIFFVLIFTYKKSENTRYGLDLSYDPK